MRNPKGVIAFLLLAFAIAWIAWEIPLRMGVSATSATFQLFALPGAFAPAIAAILVRVFGHEGFADAGLKLPLRRWPYFVFALFLPLLIVGAMILIARWSGLAQPDLTLTVARQSLSGSPAGAILTHLPLLIVPQMIVMAILFTPLLWGEEFGWRGYLQPRLFPGKPVAAAAVTGVIWAVWHFPVILRGYDFGSQAVLGAAVFLVSCSLFSFIFAWLVERTGSIWCSSLAHSATNMIGGGLTTLLFAGARQPALTSYAGILAWGPVLVVCLAIGLFGRRAKSLPRPAEAT